jgi:hypothetical protein
MSKRSRISLLALAALSLPSLVFALPHSTARLNGAQEVPPVNTPATGTASIRLNETRTQLTYDITVEDLTGAITLAHFHNAPTGQNGGVVKTITGNFVGSTASGVWSSTDAEPLTPAMVAELFAGNIYMNVHTAMHGGGEIRGQVDVIAGLHARASLNGAQENPPVNTPATGTGVFTLTEAGLTYDITVEGLSGAITLAHFHNAIPGQNGGVVKTITPSFVGNTATGIWTKNDAEPLTPALIAQLLSEGLYVNIHTAANPGGEIRGQVRLMSSSGLTGRLNGAQEVPPVPEVGTGTGSFALNEARTALQFNVTVENLTGAIQLAHFHNAPAGQNGGVVRTITTDFSGNTASGVWTSTDAEPLTPALVNELLAGRIYVNVHTAAHPGGELRGQLSLTTGIGRTSTLDGGEEVPPVNTPAKGTGSLVLTNDGVVFDVTTADLTTPMTNAHFHAAPVGVNGGVVRTILGDFTNDTATGTWRPTDAEPFTVAQLNNYLTGNHYLNVHSQMHGGGEIRGQLTAPSVVGIGPMEAAPITASLTQNFPNPFNPATTIRYELANREHVVLTLHDVAGRQIRTLVDEVQGGPQAVRIDAAGLASGVYFYRIATPSFNETKKLVLTK